MVSHEQKPKQFDFNNITVSFRFFLPLMLGGYFVAYNHDREVQQQQFSDVKTAIVDIKSNQSSNTDKLWQAIKGYGTKTDCLQNQISKCCKGSTYCV